MPFDPRVLWLALASYVAGGIPSGYIITRQLRGFDIRERGSGNPGAANVYRVVGKGPGIATLILDALKGFLSVQLAKHYFPDQLTVLTVCGALAIVGHVWTIFLRFKGGKAVATSAGVFAALLPKPLGLALVIFVIFVALTRHISAGSMAAAVAFPVFAWTSGAPTPLAALATASCLLILIKHIPNFKRLMAGRELHFHKAANLEQSEKKP